MYYTTLVPSWGPKNRIFGDRCITSGGAGTFCRSKMCEWEGVIRYRLRKCLSCAKLIYYFNKTMQWKEIFPGTKCKTSSCSTFWSEGRRFPGFFTPLLLLRQRHQFDFDFHVKLIWVATLVQMAEVILDPDWAAGAIVGSPICQENLHSQLSQLLLIRSYYLEQDLNILQINLQSSTCAGYLKYEFWDLLLEIPGQLLFLTFNTGTDRTTLSPAWTLL